MKTFILLMILSFQIQANTIQSDLICAGLFSRAFQQTYNNGKQDLAEIYGPYAVAIGYHTVMTEIKEGFNPDFVIMSWDNGVKEEAENMTTPKAILHYARCVRRATDLVKAQHEEQLTRDSSRQ